jgi:hypothetical protein
MSTVYRQPGEVIPDREPNVIYLTEQARVLGLRAKKMARSAKVWAYIAVGVNVVNVIYQVIYLAVKYRWF